jgi:hypothetical protein
VDPTSSSTITGGSASITAFNHNDLAPRNRSPPQRLQTTERGGVRGFDRHKRVKGKKSHIWVDILGIPITNRVEPANMPDRRAGERLLAGLAPLWPTIGTVIADAGHESSKLARKLARQLSHDGWNVQIVKRKRRTFKVAGFT